MDSVPSRQERQFFRVVSIATAIGFAAVASSLAALRPRTDGFAFVFSPRVVVVGIAAAALGWGYWQIVLRWIRRSNGKPTRKIWVLSVAMAVLGLVAFLYPIRFVAEEKFSDVFVGLVAAFLVLAVVAFCWWKTAKFFSEA